MNTSKLEHVASNAATVAGATVQPGAPIPAIHRAEADAVTEVMRREKIYRRLLGAGDAASALGAVLITLAVWHLGVKWPILAVPVVIVLVSKIQGLYDRDDMVIRKSTLGEWRGIIEMSAITSIAVYISLPEISSAVHGGGMRQYVFTVFAMFGLNLVARIGARHLAAAFSPAERCLIVGDAESGAALRERIDALAGVELVGTVNHVDMDGDTSDLRSLADQLRIHRLIIVPDSYSTDAATLELVRSAKWIGLRVSLFPSLLAAMGGCTVFDDLDGVTVLGVPRLGLSRSDFVIKRTFDAVGAGLGLLISAPLLAIAAVVIRFDSRGPVFFRQTRVGRDGQLFEMVKLRTMVDGADDMREELRQLNEAGAGLFKIADDPRVTRAGRWLRRTHLDELPQLWNVLRGEMSLVGPRPLVVEEDLLIAGGDRYRLHLTPGMTGPWQIRGPLDADLAEMAKLDYVYISTWSLWRDIDIILKTVGRVLSRNGH